MTGDPPHYQRRVAAVLAAVVAQGDRPTWPAGLVEDCRAYLAVAGVGLALADATGPMGVAAATPGVGRAGEDLQFAMGEGPCRMASATGRMVHAPDLATDDRWVQYGAGALAVGIKSAFSAPLDVGAVRIGVLDIYLNTAGPLTVKASNGLQIYAAAATAVLLLLAHAGSGLDQDADVVELADIRPVVHQAAGMVSVQLEVDLTTALLRLRAHAFSAGTPLRQVAADVVGRRVVFDDSTAEGITQVQPNTAPPGGDDVDPTDLEETGR